MICDWNGAPTDLGELEIDLMAKLIEAKSEDLENERMLYINDSLNEDCDSQMQETIVPRSISSHTTLTENDGSQLNFLTVPPHVRALERRMSKYQNHPLYKHPPIPEEASEKPPVNNKSSPIKNPTSKTQTGAASKLKTNTNLSKMADLVASPPKKARMKPLRDNIKKESAGSNKWSMNTCKVSSPERKYREQLEQTDTNRYKKKDISSNHGKQVKHQGISNHQPSKDYDHEHKYKPDRLDSPVIIIDD